MNITTERRGRVLIRAEAWSWSTEFQRTALIVQNDAEQGEMILSKKIWGNEKQQEMCEGRDGQS